MPTTLGEMESAIVEAQEAVNDALVIAENIGAGIPADAHWPDFDACLSNLKAIKRLLDIAIPSGLAEEIKSEAKWELELQEE